MKIEKFIEELRALGAKTSHEQRILRAWLQGQPLNAGARRQRAETFLPSRLLAALDDLQTTLSQLATVKSTHPGQDGSSRLLVELIDGQTVESVLLPRDGVCVSSQLGCAVGCTFCMTGKGGLIRQLGSAEILAQVVLARRIRPVKKVVFMGMGEPSHNLDNVLPAIDLLGMYGAIGHKNLVFSTVGDLRVFEQLPAMRVKPALALSLHSTNANLRSELLPRAPKIAPDELVRLGETYARQTGYPIQYQWTLLDGVNDSVEEIDRLIALLSGKYAMMNFIPFNSVSDTPFKRPSLEKANALVRRLREHGIVACLRDSAGQDVDGGCGQLRARHIHLTREKAGSAYSAKRGVNDD